MFMLFLIYFQAALGLIETWRVRPDYHHGFLIPLISLYIVWLKRDELKTIRIEPAYWTGISVMFLAGTIHLLGAAGGVISLQELSIIIMILGLILIHLGVVYLKILAFPVLYLLFMIPLADVITNPLHWPFQLTTAKMAVAMVQLLGFPAFLDNTYILLPGITLEVARACSGVNYLISILAIGLPMAYILRVDLSRKIILVGSAILIGIIANWVRVLLICVLFFYGVDVIHGPFHIFQALFVAQIGFISLFIGVWLLSRNPQSDSKLKPGLREDIESGDNRRKMRLETHQMSWVLSLGTLIVLGLFILLVKNPEPVFPKSGLETFPLKVGQWEGKRLDPEQFPHRVKEADREMARVYRDPSGREFQFYVAYFDTQEHRKELVSYRTAWLHDGATPLVLKQDGSDTYRINEVQAVRSEQIYRVLSWYQINGEIIHDRLDAKIKTTLGTLLEQRSNGGLIILSERISPGHEEPDYGVEKLELVRNLLEPLKIILP